MGRTHRNHREMRTGYNISVRKSVKRKLGRLEGGQKSKGETEGSG
jgi:hypothetical protein